MSEFISPQNRAAALRTAEGVFQAWESRTKLVKRELAAASAANDAKTVRLRALRLEKERLDAEAAHNNPPPVSTRKAGIKVRSQI
jgi:hypothetical protein